MLIDRDLWIDTFYGLQEFRQMAVQLVSVPHPGIAERIQLTWPWLGNFGHFLAIEGGFLATEAYPHYWYDEAKKPA